MILIAIVDNNQEEMQALEALVKNRLERESIAHVIHKFDSGVEFICSRAAYDIVFMETRLEDMEDLDAARFLRIVNKDAKLVFVTHQAQLAIRGYEVDAMDFILKPVDQSIVDSVMNRALKSLEKCGGNLFALKTPSSVISLSTFNIYYVEVYDHDLIYHTKQGDYRVRGRLGEVREKLGDRYFIQCSRSYLVNIRHVESLHSDHLIVNGEKVQITKTHHKKIEQMFMSYLNGAL